MYKAAICPAHSVFPLTIPVSWPQDRQKISLKVDNYMDSLANPSGSVAA